MRFALAPLLIALAGCQTVGPTGRTPMTSVEEIGAALTRNKFSFGRDPGRIHSVEIGRFGGFLRGETNACVRITLIEADGRITPVPIYHVTFGDTREVIAFVFSDNSDLCFLSDWKLVPGLGRIRA